MDLIIKHLESELSKTKQQLYENDQKKCMAQYNPHKVSKAYRQQIEKAIEIIKNAQLKGK